MKLNSFVLVSILFVSPMVIAGEWLVVRSSLDFTSEQRYSLELNEEGIFSLNVPEGFLDPKERKIPMYGRIRFHRNSRYEFIHAIEKFSEYSRIIDGHDIAPFTSEIGSIPTENGINDSACWKCTIHNPETKDVFCIFSLENDFSVDIVLIKESSIPIIKDLIKQSYEIEKKLFPK